MSKAALRCRTIIENVGNPPARARTAPCRLAHREARASLDRSKWILRIRNRSPFSIPAGREAPRLASPIRKMCTYARAGFRPSPFAFLRSSKVSLADQQPFVAALPSRTATVSRQKSRVLNPAEPLPCELEDIHPPTYHRLFPAPPDVSLSGYRSWTMRHPEKGAP